MIGRHAFAPPIPLLIEELRMHVPSLALMMILSGALPSEDKGKASATASATATAPANETIRQQDLRADLFFLAGDRFRGRLTDTPENDLASEYIASRFARMGLKKVGRLDSYYQGFSLVKSTLGRPGSLTMEPQGANTRTRFQAGIDFYPAAFSASGDCSGPLVFAGFGIADPARGHDDYKDLNVKGAIVVVLDHEPGEKDPKSPFDGLVTSEVSTQWRKALAAQERGARGVLFVADVHNHPGSDNLEAASRGAWPAKPPRIERYLLRDWVERIRIPVAIISTATARTLLEDSGHTFEEQARRAEKPGAACMRRDALAIALSTDVRRHVVADRNVLGALEGADPELKNEWVVISCHHDHNGADGDTVYNGADDNGSGTVAMLEIAEAYTLAAEQGKRPKRSILFAAFNSEERGLLGSWAFVEHPPVLLKQVAAVLNMDMIGRDEEVPEGGGPRFRGLPVQSAESNRNSVNLMAYSRCPELARVVESANAPFGLTLKKVLDNNPSNLLRRSDQWPFLHSGVPALFFHTGLHPDYHTSSDRPEKIHYAKMERIARLIHQASWDLAEAPTRPHLEQPDSSRAREAASLPR
jgi:hypothetical protein